LFFFFFSEERASQTLETVCARVMLWT